MYIMDEIKCEFCGNVIDLDDTPAHANCKEFYLFMLDERIEKLRIQLIALTLMKLKAILPST